MTTPILQIPEAADGEVNQYLRLNEGMRALEAAANDYLSVSLASGNVTLSAAQFTRYQLFDCTGHSVSRGLTIQQSKRLFFVKNSGTAIVNVKLGSTSFSLSAGKAGFFYSSGLANGLIRVDILIGETSFAPVVSSAASNVDASAASAGSYTRFSNAAPTHTFNSSAGLAAGAEYHGRYVGSGSLTIVGAGSMVVNPPAGGTLEIPRGGTYTVKIVSSTEADLFGVTVAP